MIQIIHRVWLGARELPPQYQDWQIRFHQLNPSWVQRLWTDANLGEIGIDVSWLRDQWPSSLAAQSNAVRLKAVLDHGGAYFDWDFEPFKPIDPIFPEWGAAAALQHDGRICNGFFAAVQPRSGWVERQWMQVDKWRRLDATWGVDLMTKVPRDGLTLIDPNLVYPFPYDAPAESRAPHAETAMLHHFAGNWGNP